MCKDRQLPQLLRTNPTPCRVFSQRPTGSTNAMARLQATAPQPHAADPASRQGVAAGLQINGQTNMRQTGCHATPESDASPFQGVRVPNSLPQVKVAA